MNNLQSPVPETKNIIIGNNNTGNIYWVGINNGIDFFAGQTFKSPGSGNLQHVSLFPSLIIGNPVLQLSLHEFDEATHTWRDKRAECELTITKSMEGAWFKFNLNNTALQVNAHYGFKLRCKSGLIAIAETPWNFKDIFGEEWTASSASEKGNFHHDFNLAFQAEIAVA